jgi:hypothetical protein
MFASLRSITLAPKSQTILQTQAPKNQQNIGQFHVKMEYLLGQKTT